MTPEELDAIRARVEAATEAPWFGSAGGLHVYGATPGDEVAQCRRPADATFVRHARTDLPAALDEIARLRAALGEARAEVEQVSAARAKPLLAALMQVTAERDEARAERDSVQFALDGFRAVARRDNEHLIARAEAAEEDS